ncbi:glycogen debranching N-terminal domain-containing protein [Plantactinospora mayteni]|uniref:Amylo-alpha-1,6-glucosidase n=1 Tax=Plantactinospora mayteni TaxID=566021 RepID=A0ABQ4F2E4_9ACTN|nr:glycogen debranching N-terminal domain-containing protein [Plantactinospora mayteni]GIH01015.1 amylo-alpha-1,6-glucosidase [Plantactinospora mayteni]
MEKHSERATPANPMPGRKRHTRAPSAVVRTQPPELGPDSVAVVNGRTFMVSGASGDIPPGSIGGLVHDDTRLLNRWELTLGGAALLILGSGTVDDDSAAFFLTNTDLPALPANSIGIRRQRFLSDRLHERIQVQFFNRLSQPVQLRLSVGTDFADLFEIKDAVPDRSARITRTPAPNGRGIFFCYRNLHFEARAEIEADPRPDRIEADDLVWDLHLSPGVTWQCQVTVNLPQERDERETVHRHFGEGFELVDEDPATSWREDCPDFELDSELLRDVLEKTQADLVALRIEKCPGKVPIVLPAAGLPWFLTIFGRDSLITAHQSLGFGPRLARGTLQALALNQGSQLDDFRDEEPGKIPHEVRSGELTRIGVKPHSPYFGTADATQLWLILLSEYWRWTQDSPFVLGLRRSAYQALGWIDRYGDPDGDGYVEYATRSPEGLGNHCWRDSPDGVIFSDGRMPTLPIATCEIQGYTYDAKLRMAELADGPFDDPPLAARLRTEAAELRDRFNRDFWIDRRGGYYAIGLDGDKRQIDSMTSNMGHLLWSGIVPPDRARLVVEHLMSETMFSGWGIRTTADSDECYNPIGYHHGTVWPHDNSIIAHGFARYGFRDEANRIALAMLHAAQFFEHRLPEALSGYDRAYGRKPVPYPTACSPQAWASAAPLLFLRTLLGMEVVDDRLSVQPHVPPELGRIMLRRVSVLGKEWDIEAAGRQGHIRLSLGR